MKQLNVQKEEIVGEMDMLRTSNKQLRELIMDQKEILWQGDEQQNIKFNDNIVKLKRRIENINNTTFSHLQNVQGNQKKDINFSCHTRLLEFKCGS